LTSPQAVRKACPGADSRLLQAAARCTRHGKAWQPASCYKPSLSRMEHQVSRDFPEDSVGLVSPRVAHFTAPLELACGRQLEQFELVYETYGTLNKARS